MDDDNTSNNVPSNYSSSSSSAGPSKSSEKRSKLDENHPSTSRYTSIFFFQPMLLTCARGHGLPSPELAAFLIRHLPIRFDTSGHAQDGCVRSSPSNSANILCDSSSSDDMVQVEVIRSKRRFAKRNYRQRSESASMETPPSTSPVPPTVAQQPQDELVLAAEQEPQVNVSASLIRCRAVADFGLFSQS